MQESSDRLQYAIIVPFWGEEFRRLFLAYCVPFLLTEGNVGHFNRKNLSIYIVTRAEDLDEMHKCTHFDDLCQKTEVIELQIDRKIDLNSPSPYKAVSECYSLALNELWRKHTPKARQNVVTIFFTPDQIISRNGLGEIARIMGLGYQAILIAGVRLNLSSVAPHLDAITASPGGPDETSEDVLCKLGLHHLHPISLSHDVASPEFLLEWPSHLYWIAPDRSWLVARCFHMHPLAVQGLQRTFKTRTTIDGDYVLQRKINEEKVYICTNSRRIVTFELSPPEKKVADRHGPFDMDAVVRFSNEFCNRVNDIGFDRKVIFSTGGDPDIPYEIRRQADEVAAAVVKSRSGRVEAAKLCKRGSRRRKALLRSLRRIFFFRNLRRERGSSRSR